MLNPGRWLQGRGAGTLPLESGRRRPGMTFRPRRAPPSPGLRGRPIRPHLMRAKRDNPVGVRSLVTGAGKPTVRGAQSPSGQWMANKRTPVAERRQETWTSWLAPPPVVPDNWPDTGLDARTRKGADVARWACEE